MNFNFKAWLGQVTTGHGFMVLVPTLLAVAGGRLSWTAAVPLLVAGAVGLVWPESTGLKTAAQNTATDIEGLVTAYRAGLAHGGAMVVPAAPQAAAEGVKLPAAAVAAVLLAAGLMVATCLPAHAAAPVVLVAYAPHASLPAAPLMLALAGLAMLTILLRWRMALMALMALCVALAGCASQTPAEQAAGAAAVASGLVCLADGSGHVVATSSATDPNAVKAINSAIAAGDTLMTDPACQAAIAAGAAALPAGVLTPATGAAAASPASD